MDFCEDDALDPFERRGIVRAFDILLQDQLVAEHDDDVLERRARVIFLGHAIDGDFGLFLAIKEIDDEDLFMAVP